jgi:hypothetical protein
MITQADRLLEGAIDLHCHGYPEISFDVKMRVEDLEAAQLAAQAKMKGFVLKSHMWPTVGRVYQMKIRSVELKSGQVSRLTPAQEDSVPGPQNPP